MRGLSVMQPWASLLAIGAKEYETRSFRQTYRGPVAIHASAGYPAWCRELEKLPDFAGALGRVPRPLPTGAIIALGYLAECKICTMHTANELGWPEAAFGDFSPGRWRWRFTSVRPLRTPIPFKGKLGLWSVPPEIAQRIESQVSA